MTAVPRSRGRAGRPYRRARQRLFEDTPDVCHICGHAGTTDLDHLVPLSVDESLALDPANHRRAHGVKGCPTCGRKCNQSKGAKTVLPPAPSSRAW